MVTNYPIQYFSTAYVGPWMHSMTERNDEQELFAEGIRELEQARKQGSIYSVSSPWVSMKSLYAFQ